jgi:hypothetical protein
MKKKNIAGRTIYACNPSYSESGEWEHRGLRPARAKSYQDLHLNKTNWAWQHTPLCNLICVGDISRMSKV